MTSVMSFSSSKLSTVTFKKCELVCGIVIRFTELSVSVQQPAATSGMTPEADN